MSDGNAVRRLMVSATVLPFLVFQPLAGQVSDFESIVAVGSPPMVLLGRIAPGW